MTLDFVQNKPAPQPPMILLYAVTGWGKGLLASCFPNPIFLQVEVGLEGIDGARTPIIESYEWFMHYLHKIRHEDHDCKTLIVDTVTELDKLVNDSVCRDRGIKSMEGVDFGKTYVDARKKWEDIYDTLKAIRKERGMAIINIGHVAITSFKDPKGSDYNRYRVLLRSNDKPASDVAGYAEQNSDAILFGDYQIFKDEKKNGFSQKVVAHGGQNRIIYTSHSASHVAKNRYHMPEQIMIPTISPMPTEEEKNQLFMSVAQYIPYYNKGE